MKTPYVWTPADEAQWQRFTKGVPDYGTDARNAGRLKPATASDVIATFRSMLISAAPWLVTVAACAYAFTHI